MQQFRGNTKKLKYSNARQNIKTIKITQTDIKQQTTK